MGRDTTKTRAAVEQLPAASVTPRKENKKRGRDGGVNVHSDQVTMPEASELAQPAKVKPPAQPARGPGTGHSKRTHEYNKLYEEKRERILQVLYGMEYDSNVGTRCGCNDRTSGREETPTTTTPRVRLWRCVDCADTTSCCGECLKTAHAHLPFHKVQKWTGTFFDRSSLGECGLQVHLGHNGDPCPSGKGDNPRAKEMTIGDVTGIHCLIVNFCVCTAPAVPDYEQLLLARLFPATFSQPHTAFTFRLMEHWHLDILQGKKPVYDYWLSLRRRTKATSKDLGGYKNFLRAGRYWRDLTSRKQSGQGQGIDAFLPPNRYPGSVAVVCPACPEPEFNLEPDWRERVKDQEHRYKYRKVLCIDGQYKTSSKIKKNDVDDRPLNSGGGYVSPFDETLAYEAKWVTDSEETGGTCPGVDAMHRMAGGRSTTFSGAVEVVCDHEIACARSIVNLRKGEKFVLLDLAYRNALGPAPDVDIPLIFSSDRACQYSINAVRRWAAQFPDDHAPRTILEKATWAVPKLHIHGHKEECQYSMHFAYIPGAGRTCGEGVERNWQEYLAAGMISKDANIGHREEILSDTQRDGDHKKVLEMSTALTKKAKDAAANVARTKSEFDHFAATIDPDTIRRWEQQWPNEEGVRDDKGQVKSRYRADAKKMPGREQIMSMVAKEETKRGGAWAGGRGPTALLKRLIELEGEQAKLRVRVKNASNNDSGARSAIDKARVNLRVQIKLVRRLQKVHMPEIAELLAAEEATSENVDEDDLPEDDALYLPSSFPKEDREKLGLVQLAATELRMRRFYAEGELELLKLAIRVYLIDVKKKQRNVQGTAANTRAQSKLKKDMKRRDKHIARYNVHYDAMVALGYDTTDPRYQRVEQKAVEDIEDIKLPAELGTGRLSSDWFWREGRDVAAIKTANEREVAAMNEEELRVRYFRLWANWKRWDEQWVLVGVFFDRTARHFAKMEEVWLRLAEVATKELASTGASVETGCELEAPGVGVDNHVVSEEHRVGEAAGRRAYAYKKAAFYARLREEAVDRRQFAGAYGQGRGWDGWQPVADDAALRARPAKRARKDRK